MKIDFYCHPGSNSFVFTPPDVWGRGVGGAELSLISLAETFAKDGHRVRVYNEPYNNRMEDCSGRYNGVYYLNSTLFNLSKDRDVFILFRNPYPYLQGVNARVKLFWSCDQVTTGNYATDIYPFVDKGVCISLFHQEDHIERYGVSNDKITWIDLGVRLEDYVDPLPKVKGRLIFCSVPHRGLQWLLPIYQTLKVLHRDITLHITSDYTLWGRGIGPNDTDMRTMWRDVSGVDYLGNIPRRSFIEQQKRAELLIYPHYPVSGYPELFGISVAECMAAGTVPIISTQGGLNMTATGAIVINGDPRDPDIQFRYIEAASFYLRYPNRMDEAAKYCQSMANRRFDWTTIAKQWYNLFEEILNGRNQKQPV